MIAGVYNNTTSSYGVKIALNNKGNGFLAPYFVGLNNQPLRAFADVTGDGIADIVTQGENYSSTSLTVFPGDGIGSFGAPITSIYNSDGQVSSVSSSAFGDFNSDGYLDLALNLSHYTNNTYVRAIAFIPGLGNGKFGTAIFSDITNYSNELRLTVGDFNGDARLDIMGINGRERHYFAGEGEGKFTDTPGIASLGEFQSAQTVAVDLNRDGKDEIIFLDQNNRRLIINLNRCGNVTTPGIYGNV